MDQNRSAKVVALLHRIIIGEDFNEPQSITSRMTNYTGRLNLELISSPSYGRDTPNTYVRGKKTLDHIWISRDIVQSITGFRYLPFHAGIGKYHRGVFIHLHTNEVNQLSPNYKVTNHNLSSKNPDPVAKYLVMVLKGVRPFLIREKLDFIKRTENLSEVQLQELHLIDANFT